LLQKSNGRVLSGEERGRQNGIRIPVSSVSIVEVVASLPFLTSLPVLQRRPFAVYRIFSRSSCRPL